MRDRLRDVDCRHAQHAGLAYDVWAPVEVESDGDHRGKVPPDERPKWLGKVCAIGAPAGYAAAFNRWRGSFNQDGVTATATVELASRLLLGHGNAAPTEVGLTLHHTWGVPYLPGSSLKGLCAHYVATVYGGDDPHWRGAKWQETRITGRPGEHYRELFGSPEADNDEGSLLQGAVIFHDALWDPAGANKPLTPDVLTVHQKKYYNSKGGSWPNDYDKPIPIGFLTVAPGTKFHLAVSGDNGWGRLALELLLEALERWGVGGKTTSGYGRIKPGAKITAPTEPASPELQAFNNLLSEHQGTVNDLLTAIEARLGEMIHWPEAQRLMALEAIRNNKKIPSDKRTKDRLAAIAQALRAGQLPAAQPAGSPALLEFRNWLADQPNAQETMTAIQNDWLNYLDQLDPAEKQAALKAIRAHLTDPACAEELALLEELLS